MPLEPEKPTPLMPASVEVVKIIPKDREEPLRIPENEVVVKVETNMEEDLPPAKPIELTAMEIEQEKKRRALEEAKRLLGSSNSIEIVPIKRGRKPNEPPSKLLSYEPPSQIVPSHEPSPKMAINEPPIKIAVNEQVSKMHIHEPPLKIPIGELPCNKIPIHEPSLKVPIREQQPKISVRDLQTKLSGHESIIGNVDSLIHNDESNDELSEPPNVTLPMFEELAIKNGTGVRRKIGKGKSKAIMNFIILLRLLNVLRKCSVEWYYMYFLS